MSRSAGRGSKKGLIRFLSESGMLKRVPRSGWSVAGIRNAESVADHSFRCAVIGYLLAHMEEAAGYKVLLMTLFNDIQEARITDLHKMAQRYFKHIQKAENVSFCDQIDSLPAPIRNELRSMRREYVRQHSLESIIARDADILECLLQAKEYYEDGFAGTAQFMKKAPHFLKTKSARTLWRQAQRMRLNEWWASLSAFRR